MLINEKWELLVFLRAAQRLSKESEKEEVKYLHNSDNNIIERLGFLLGVAFCVISERIFNYSI